MQRIKFVDGSRTLPYRTDQPASATQAQQSQLRLLVRTPSNEISRLSIDMTGRLQQSDDLRHSISWSWGPTLDEIPRRLGRNKALDAAARTILLDHSDACIGDNSVDPYALGVIHLFRTLGILRTILDDPFQRSEAETLCAVMLVSISQVGTAVCLTCTV